MEILSFALPKGGDFLFLAKEFSPTIPNGRKKEFCDYFRRGEKMINFWRLSHFKSVYKEKCLDLAPLTIFTGANSSGKSTFIQSILLTTQTLQNPVVSRPIILNGHIQRLGSYDDIVSNGHDSDSIMIGFRLNIEGEGQEVFSNKFYYPGQHMDQGKIDCHFTFSTSDGVLEREIIKLQPQLDECHIKYSFKRDKEHYEDEIHIRKTEKTFNERLSQYNLSERQTKRLEQMQPLRYEVIKPISLEKHMRPLFYRNRPSGKPIGASLRHFLPGEFAMIYDTQEHQVEQYISLLTGEQDFGYRTMTEDVLIPNNTFKKLIFDIIESKISEILNEKSKSLTKLHNQIEKLKEEFNFADLSALFQDIPIQCRRSINLQFSERREDIKRTLKLNISPKYAIAYLPVSGVPEIAIDFIQHFFSTKVKYLGPLRDEPKSVYPLSGSTDTKDIGFKGEHTAAVLDVHKNTIIEYIPSEFFASPKSRKNVKTTLWEAVQDWLNYMGVASGFTTSDKGKLGHEMRVSIGETNSLHDLTHVGVGVSQILPILVLALLADKGSTLIFEQPELHLHPRVQTRLADFFVSMNMVDKQCIVESHSEYLINRLRYWAASTEGDTFCNSVIMYFVEKEGDQSIYQAVKMNKYGYIEQWPKGFFDEGEENSKKVLAAALEKRKKEAPAR